jgi:hypothetical protein
MYNSRAVFGITLEDIFERYIILVLNIFKYFLNYFNILILKTKNIILINFQIKNI